MALIKKKQQIGLFFGSFNPIHFGHLIIANYIVENLFVDKIWFVVSPHNPLKNSNELLNDDDRLALVKLAIKGNRKFVASDFEFYLSKPSFTVNTLNYLKQKHKDKDFTLIIGEDNLDCFEKWKDYQGIINNNRILVYPRPDINTNKFSQINTIQRINAPQIEISSTLIRELIRENKSIQYLLPESVRKEIEKNKYYCNS
ncbi:MAG: nicotinate-nucleotide adenylyltransferase [Bacteroidetes bacterium]|nr:nicotinate-nucleotide adenylyltransferase [Bacteroidota bacterium]